MANEQQTDQYQRTVEGLRTKFNISIALAIASFNLVIFLSAWMVRGFIQPGNIGLVLVPVLLFVEASFCIYTAIIFIASDPLPTAKLKTRILWWHGCGVLILLGLAVAGALINFVFVSAFSGIVQMVQGSQFSP